jgi:hypothetical protein
MLSPAGAAVAHREAPTLAPAARPSGSAGKWGPGGREWEERESDFATATVAAPASALAPALAPAPAASGIGSLGPHAHHGGASHQPMDRRVGFAALSPLDAAAPLTPTTAAHLQYGRARAVYEARVDAGAGGAPAAPPLPHDYYHPHPLSRVGESAVPPTRPYTARGGGGGERAAYGARPATGRVRPSSSRRRRSSAHHIDSYGTTSFSPTLAGQANRRGGVYERLSSPEGYTGVYRRAYNTDGRINAFADTGTSAVPTEFVGDTNTNTNETIHHIRHMLRPNLKVGKSFR